MKEIIQGHLKQISKSYNNSQLDHELNRKLVEMLEDKESGLEGRERKWRRVWLGEGGRIPVKQEKKKSRSDSQNLPATKYNTKYKQDSTSPLQAKKEKS